MQVVIDIPNNMKEMCRWHKDCVCNLTSIEVDILAEAIRNGVVLPKGHGRLIDEKDLSLMTVHLIDGVFVCTAPTIIEAEGGKE